MTRKLTLALAALLTIALSSTAARADSIAITLDTPVQTINPGDTVVYFYATITSDPTNAGDLYFNQDGYSLDSFLSIDDSGFFANFPYPFPANDSVDDLLFAINLPGNEPLGPYLGSFFIFGGSDSNALDPLGSVNFEIDNVAASGTSPVPEPSSLFMFSTGLLALAGGCKRKWQTP